MSLIHHVEQAKIMNFFSLGITFPINIEAKYNCPKSLLGQKKSLNQINLIQNTYWSKKWFRPKLIMGPCVGKYVSMTPRC